MIRRQRCSPLIAVAFLFLHLCHAGTPAEPRYYHHQPVDHHKNNNDTAFWSQRYYTSAHHFQGAGFPIFVILGGEGAIEPSTGLFYPFVTDRLAKAFGAFVLEPEHRFYGESQPTHERDSRVELLTPEQALLDAVGLIRHTQDSLLCSRDRFSPKYCPVVTIGGSYPGFLSAMARLRFPSVVDIAYAASAPVKFYAQQVNAEDYYNHISLVAEKSKKGCAHAVRSTLDSMNSEFALLDRMGVEKAALSLGFCPESVPDYIQDGDTFRTEIFMIVGYTFANDNMANYPPDNRTKLFESCTSFSDTTKSPKERAKQFFESHFADIDNDCINMSLQLPTGPNATISGGDWSGVGTGADGESWDFQTCTLLVEAIGFSNSSMFPLRNWSLDWLNRHCQSRFGVSPEPHSLVDQWHFDDLRNVSRILFTNGLNDGWSMGSILSNLSDTVLVLNFENGAHHSDLSHKGPSEEDTEDIRRGFDAIQVILGSWLEDVRLAPAEKQGASQTKVTRQL